MSNKFEIGKKYRGDYPILSYDWAIRHNVDDICTEQAGKTDYPLYDCLFGYATYLGKASDCHCDRCNRFIKNGYKFVDDDGWEYCYGPECVNNAVD